MFMRTVLCFRIAPVLLFHVLRKCHVIETVNTVNGCQRWRVLSSASNTLFQSVKGGATGAKNRHDVMVGKGVRRGVGGGVKDVPSTELSAEGSSSASDRSGRDTVDVVDRMLLSRSRSELTNRIVI